MLGLALLGFIVCAVCHTFGRFISQSFYRRKYQTQSLIIIYGESIGRGFCKTHACLHNNTRCPAVRSLSLMQSKNKASIVYLLATLLWRRCPLFGFHAPSIYLLPVEPTVSQQTTISHYYYYYSHYYYCLFSNNWLIVFERRAKIKCKGVFWHY